MEIENEFGVGGDVEVSLNFVGGSVVEGGGAVKIEIIVGFSGGVKMGGLETRRSEITDATVGD